MGGVNVAVRRYQLWSSYGTDPYQAVAAVSGYNLSQTRGNAVMGAAGDTLGVSGSTAATTIANLNFGAVGLTPSTYLTFTSEPVNPLYVGEYAVGSYRVGSPMPSGSGITRTDGPYIPGKNLIVPVVSTDAAVDCASGMDGAENAPAALPADGVWSSRLCGVGHSSWMKFAVKAGRTATVEVIATDETGAASTRKAMPLLGIWHASDAAGSLPGIARVTTAFNSTRSGMTQLRASFATAESVRLAVTDARGDGRPDYTYRARVLYADAVSPSRLSGSGGFVAIAGTGFSASCMVMVGGVAARVTSVSATEMDVVVPALSSGTKDVVITDLATGGSTTMTGALVYGGVASDVLMWTVQPLSSVAVGVPSAIGLRLVDAAGAPVKSGTVTLVATAGNAVFGACNLAQCTLATDSTGMLQAMVAATAPGVVVVKATSGGGATVQLSFVVTAVAQAITFLRQTEYVAAGTGAAFTPAVAVTVNGAAPAGTAVAWTASSVRVGMVSTQSVSNLSGVANVVAAGSLRDNETAIVQACAWTSVCATQSVIGVPAANLRISAISGDAQSVSMVDSLGNIVLRVEDGAGHPVAGATVSVYQVVTGWQPPCTTGRCAAAPIYGKSTSTAISDDDGLITVAPLQYATTAAVTKSTASVGTQGTITVTLVKTP